MSDCHRGGIGLQYFDGQEISIDDRKHVSVGECAGCQCGAVNSTVPQYKMRQGRKTVFDWRQVIQNVVKIRRRDVLTSSRTHPTDQISDQWMSALNDCNRVSKFLLGRVSFERL